MQRISVPDMNRLGLAIEQQGISHTHANRTLVVSYLKPPQILQVPQNAPHIAEVSELCVRDYYVLSYLEC